MKARLANVAVLKFIWRVVFSTMAALLNQFLTVAKKAEVSPI
jgi:hypothetical protein